MEWWNKPSWDARLRGALFNKDYDLAQTIALDRIHRRNPEDTETILATNACYSLQHGRLAMTLSRAYPCVLTFSSSTSKDSSFTMVAAVNLGIPFPRMIRNTSRSERSDSRIFPNAVECG